MNDKNDKKCGHIYGVNLIDDDSYFVYKSDLATIDLHDVVLFKYCPKCGELIKEEK